MEKCTTTEVIIMDFTKAFDRVNHSLLVHKLDHYGIWGSTDIWITNFLSEWKQAVVADGARSNYINMRSGVPQGSVLGPCLFPAYINYLPDSLIPFQNFCRQHYLVLFHSLCSRPCSSTRRPKQAGAVGEKMGDVLPPGQIQLSANHQEQEDQPATSRLHPPQSDPGDSPLSEVLGHDTAEWPWMGNSHQHLCQGKQDAQLPQKKPESLFSQDQGAYLQGTDPTHHWVRMCSVGTPQWQAHLQPWEGQEKGSMLRAEDIRTPQVLAQTEMVNPTAQMLDHTPHHAVQDHHWSSVWGALTSNSSLQVEEATTVSSTNASAAAWTTEAKPSPAQSGTGTNSPQMQFCPPPLVPSSGRCHPPPNKFPNCSSFFCLYHYQHCVVP